MWCIGRTTRILFVFFAREVCFTSVKSVSDACTRVRTVALPAARSYECVFEVLSRFRFLFNLYLKWHSNSCALLVMHIWDCA